MDTSLTPDQQEFMNARPAVDFFNFTPLDGVLSFLDPEFAHRLIRMVEEKAERSGIDLQQLSQPVRYQLFRNFGAQLLGSVSEIRRQNPNWNPLNEKRTRVVYFLWLEGNLLPTTNLHDLLNSISCPEHGASAALDLVAGPKIGFHGCCDSLLDIVEQRLAT